MSKHSSLVGRAVLAVAFLVGFYVLALGVAAGLIYLPYAEWRYADRISPRLAIFTLGGAAIILWSLLPRPDSFPAPGPGLALDRHPRLRDAIARVAKATAQSMPSEVYLVPDMNAWVAQRGGVMGVASRRVMGLGLPLLNRLSVAQLSAVLAHEFGHYYGGDTMLGPWIYKTRAAIGRTLHNLAQHSRALAKPFEWYGLMFLRLTHAVSRAQEYSADALAARTVGSQPLVDGLKTVHGAGAAFGGFWTQEYVPALQSGFRPPFQQGFQSYVTTDRVAKAVEDVVKGELNTPQTNPYDTHPPLRDRIAALGTLGMNPQWKDDRAAVTLLDDLDAVEKSLIDWIVGPEHAGKLQPIPWADVGRLVWGPQWRRAAREHAHRLKGMTPLRLATLSDEPADLAVSMKFAASAEVTTLEHIGTASAVFGAALASALLDAGWQVKTDPGDAVLISPGGDEIRPFELWASISGGTLSIEAWRALCERTGISTLDLGRTPTDPA